jgi:hypothetical protein
MNPHDDLAFARLWLRYFPQAQRLAEFGHLHRAHRESFLA